MRWEFRFSGDLQKLSVYGKFLTRKLGGKAIILHGGRVIRPMGYKDDILKLGLEVEHSLGVSL